MCCSMKQQRRPTCRCRPCTVWVAAKIYKQITKEAVPESKCAILNAQPPTHASPDRDQSSIHVCSIVNLATVEKYWASNNNVKCKFSIAFVCMHKSLLIGGSTKQSKNIVLVEHVGPKNAWSIVVFIFRVCLVYFLLCVYVYFYTHAGIVQDGLLIGNVFTCSVYCWVVLRCL